MIDPALHASIERWKLSLLDLTGGNRLLDVSAAHDPTSVPLPDADPVAVAAALASGGAFAIEAAFTGDAHGDVRAEAGPGRLRTSLTADELERRLVAIRRHARADLADRGDHTAWLGLGLLTWCDAGGVAHTAPLVMWPIELDRGAGGDIRMIAAEGQEQCMNLVLAEQLRRAFELVLPVTDDLATLLEAAEAMAVTRAGWRVDRAAQLGNWSLAQLAMWNDLQACGEQLLASPILVHLASAGGQLAAGAGIAFAQPSGVAAAAIVAPTAAACDVMAPLDADASQLAAVAAAGAGASFVLQGPPGTGKSQTIANLIVHCVSQGKTVLFVTEKTAALEVVQQRLAAVGLGEFCVELYGSHAGPRSAKAIRTQVMAQLGRVLERSFRPGVGGIGDDARLAELRAALDGHVAALHRTGPFGRSLHTVLGRLVELRAAPRATLAERDATGLDRGTFDRRKLAVEALAAAAIPVEPVASHAWRASTLEHLVSTPALDGSEGVLAALEEAGEAASALQSAIREVAILVPGLVARTHDQLQAIGSLAVLAAASPRPGVELLTQVRIPRGEDIGERVALIRARGGGAVEVPRDPAAFLAVASRHRALVTEVEDRFTDSVADLDAAGLWAQLRTWSGRVAPLRYVALRAARAAIRAAAIPGELHSDDAMITALESVIAERACRAALASAAAPAARWFGDLGGDPLALDLAKIEAAVGWAAELRRAFDLAAVHGGEPGRAAAWRALVAQVAGGGASGSLSLATDLAVFARLGEAVARWAPALAALAEATGIELAALAGGDDHLVALRERIETLRHALGGLREWVTFHAARRGALAAGVGPAVRAIERGDLGAAELAPAWERATLLAWADAEIAELPALARFHGAALHAHVAAFADLDRGALALARSRALVRLAERVPRVVPTPSDAPDVSGELGVLMEELKKSHGQMSLRALFAAIPSVLPRVAPCMLMSPRSVAQYLDPALPRFDVVVFDEASQLPAGHAIGTLARGESAIIVGDSQQLRPTRSPDRAAPQLESILDACIAARLPELRLGWHYRSRHEDLIAFANDRYYADRLQVFPTAHGSPDLGVSWRPVDGIYDRDGGSNRLEAEAVVADVVARLRDPAQRTRSIGVVTFSPGQAALIEDLLDQARLHDPAIDAAFGLDPTHRAAVESVLVKSCEAIQGDERDVILISVGFGRGAEGTSSGGLGLGDDFGALSQQGGEHMLNVAITRAREQVVVFSSIAPEDLFEAAPAGVRDLGGFLAFARAGGGAAKPIDDVVAASPLTAAIARALEDRGWIVRHQVGCGAYKVDLAVVDPNDTERYVLAIEHDGAAYASAPAARDRDRLRAQILGALGWRLHRIWTLDWWADPEREIQRAHGAIVAAIAASRQRRATLSPVAPATGARPRFARRGDGLAAGSTPVVRIPAMSIKPSGPVLAAGSGPTDAMQAFDSPFEGATTPVRLPRNAIGIGPYMAAAIPPGRRTPDDLFAPRHLAELGKVVEQVLAAEAPMHVDLLARRVGAYFGIGRVTQRVSDQVKVALAGRGRWGDEQDVVWRLDQDPAAVPAVRVAGHSPTGRREIDEVPLSELASAARIVVERASGISATELVRDAARLLGFARITERVTDRVAQGVQLAAARALIRIDDGKAVLPTD